MQLGLAALLAAVGGLAGLRRGRLMSVLLRVRSLRLPTWSGVSVGLPRWSGVSVRLPRWSEVLSRQTQRALAVIRLTLGILRLW
jgi:hypothetical protein